MSRTKQRKMLIVVMACIPFFWFIVRSFNVCADSVFQDETRDEDAGHLIVSMVYDDSGSMEGEKGMYCNYTFQLFLSLFGENDELFITYMSKPRTSSNYSINNNRQARVDNLRAHKNKIFTPITAVKTAYERLLNEDSGENDIYWLIVLTDGNFYDEQNNVLRQEQLDQYIDGYAKTPMSNGSNVNILYVGIGNDVNLPKSDADNVSVLQTKEPQDILTVLDYCGGFFSECIKVDKLDFIKYSVKDNTLHLDSELPLSKVVIVQHNSEEQGNISVGMDLQGNELTQSESIDIYHSYMDYDGGYKGSLRGQVTYWEKEDDYIQDGIDIIYDSNVNEEEIVVYVQPALKLDINYYNEANELVKMRECKLEDVLKAELVIKRLDTMEEIAPEVISKEYSGRISAMDRINKMTLAETDELFLSDISMVNEGMVITGNLTIANTYTYRIIQPISLYQSTISSETDFTYDRTSLTGNTQAIDVSATKNEIPFQRKDMAYMSVQYDASNFPPLFALKYKVNNDGTMELTPQFGYDNLFGKVFVNWLSVWVIPQKNIDITFYMVDMTNAVKLTDHITIQINGNNILLEIWYRIYPFLVISLAVGFIIKKRFKVRQKIYYIKMVKRDGKIVAVWRGWRRVSLTKITIKNIGLRINPFSLVPYMPNRQKCGDIIVSASAPVYRKAKSVKLNLYKWKYVKLAGFKGCNNSNIVLEIDQSVLKEGKRIMLEAGEYVYIQKNDQQYLYHLGKSR